MALPEHRSAGICLHLTALPGAYGIGELGASAHRFIDFLSHAGMRIWQFLPTGPTAYGNSPYQPLSVFAGNPLLIDIEALLDESLLLPDEVAPLTELARNRVDFMALVPLKTQLIGRACRRFIERADPARHAKFDAFCDAHDKAWLHDFALFQTLKTLHHERAWPEWDEPVRQRDGAALAAFASQAQQSIMAAKVAQFLFAEQWQKLQEHAARRGVLLFGDVPIYIALDSVDAWANRKLLLLAANGQPLEVAGVPPDYFSDDGQLWGNPLYDWEFQASTNFEWWTDRLRYATAISDMLRIDHFRGFESYWAVPASSTTARDGQWRKGPGDAIFSAMHKALGDLPIVAEDLGMITEEVNELRERHRFPGMKVLQFLLEDPAYTIEQIPENSVCYTGTHDNDTTYGWFHGSPGDVRSAEQIMHTQQTVLATTGGAKETVVSDLIRLALASPARIAMFPMQDILNLPSDSRFNTPGTIGCNWQWRLRSGDLDAVLANRVREWVASSGRSAATVLQSR
ncbi:MAG TPA: 4-alpha-glucanotransferase [Woeseiaceae bacterium]|nr:4-alpha-glucanotransferase [Woeseiaceae bacterium]